jgi:hypothetical protein
LVTVDLILEKMFKVILISVFSLFLVAVNAQEGNVAKASGSALAEGKKSGQFDIQLTGKIEKEQIEKNASYYVHTFTVAYDVKSQNAHISMVSNDERGRQVIVRFLTACGVQKVSVDGNELELYTFFEKYLK